MISKRLGQYLDHKGISFYAIENAVGASRGAISKAVKDGKNIGGHVLENILIEYRDLNPEWLMMGEGEMLKGSSSYDFSERNHSQVAEPSDDFEKLTIIKEIHDNEQEWLAIPEFRKLLKSLALSSEMEEMRAELHKLKMQFKKHIEG